MEQKLKDLIYRIVKETDPNALENLSNYYLRYEFESERKKLIVAKEEGFVTIVAFYGKKKEWIERCHLEFMTVSNDWILTGSISDNQENLNEIDDQEELNLLVNFVASFEKERPIQLVS